jgi:hypothetical protein
MANANPTCIADVLVEAPQFPQAVLDAGKEFARSKPWRGDLAERREKFEKFITDMNAAVGMNVSVTYQNEDRESSIMSRVDFTNVDAPVIIFDGRLSVATLLYTYAAAMAPYDQTMESHWGRMRWAANMFRRFFPRSFAALDTSGAYLMKPTVEREFQVDEE